MTLYCFVGHVFNREQMDDLRRAICGALKRWDPFKPWFADEYWCSGHILTKIKNGIDEAKLCIFELSDKSKPNVFMELGYAMAKEKPLILLIKKGNHLPSDLEGLDRIEYESMVELEEKLGRCLPQVLADVFSGMKVVAQLNGHVLACMDPTLPAGTPVQISEIMGRMKARGLPNAKLNETLMELQKMGVLEQNGYIWSIAEDHTEAESYRQLIETAQKNCGT